ncbi:MAG: hypothetical protein HPZ97_05375 [Oscillospiraceae bacterium]|nr:hypothetical protein [Oscillospiraceae bacterium]
MTRRTAGRIRTTRRRARPRCICSATGTATLRTAAAPVAAQVLKACAAEIKK